MLPYWRITNKGNIFHMCLDLLYDLLHNKSTSPQRIEIIEFKHKGLFTAHGLNWTELT